MPTPTGMLKRGDRIKHKETGQVCEVVERLGNDECYSVRVSRKGGHGDGKEFLLLTAGYQIKHGWEVIQ